MKVRRYTAIFVVTIMAAVAAFGQDAQPQPSPAASPQPVVDVVIQSQTGISPKKEGVIRIGIPVVRSSINAGASGQDVSEAVRSRWASFLQGPTLEVVSIDARSPLQINVEAGQKECDLVLYSAVSQKAKTSLFGSLIRVAVPVLVSAVPANANTTQPQPQSILGGTKGAAGDMANQAAGLIKASDQVVLEFNLVKVGSANTLLTKSLKIKASNDGQDIFSDLIEQATAQILAVAMKG